MPNPQAASPVPNSWESARPASANPTPRIFTVDWRLVLVLKFDVTVGVPAVLTTKYCCTKGSVVRVLSALTHAGLLLTVPPQSVFTAVAIVLDAVAKSCSVWLSRYLITPPTAAQPLA